jgi:hypothetical protein
MPETYTPEANRTLDPDAPPLTLAVHGTEAGSFLVDLVLNLPDHWDTLVEWSNSDSGKLVERLWYALSCLRAVAFSR